MGKANGVLGPHHLHVLAKGLSQRGTVLRALMVSIGRLGFFVAWEREWREGDPRPGVPVPQPTRFGVNGEPGEEHGDVE